MQVVDAAIVMNNKETRLNNFFCASAQAFTDAISKTIIGIIRIIKTSRNVNIGSAIGWLSDSSWRNPIYSATPYKSCSATTAEDEKIPILRASGLNSVPVRSMFTAYNVRSIGINTLSCADHTVSFAAIREGPLWVSSRHSTSDQATGGFRPEAVAQDINESRYQAILTP